MLENRKNVRKFKNVIVVLMAIIMILGLYISSRHIRNEKNKS